MDGSILAVEMVMLEYIPCNIYIVLDSQKQINVHNKIIASDFHFEF